jgi:hypothetical protein
MWVNQNVTYVGELDHIINHGDHREHREVKKDVITSNELDYGDFAVLVLPQPHCPRPTQ